VSWRIRSLRSLCLGDARPVCRPPPHRQHGHPPPHRWQIHPLPMRTPSPAEVHVVGRPTPMRMPRAADPHAQTPPTCAPRRRRGDHHAQRTPRICAPQACRPRRRPRSIFAPLPVFHRSSRLLTFLPLRCNIHELFHRCYVWFSKEERFSYGLI
jgi:hypothetical protein